MLRFRLLGSVFRWTLPFTDYWLFSIHYSLFTLRSSLSWVWVSELYYDRRWVGQSVLVCSPPLGLMTRFLLLSGTSRFVDMGRPVWREDGSVFYNCCCLRQRSYSQIRVPRGSWPHFAVSDLRLLQPGEPGPCIYIPQEQGGPAIPPGTGFSLTHYIQWMFPSLYRPLANRIENTFYKG
jgi:hypothetical protein